MPDDQFQFLTPEMAQRLSDASFAPDEQERLEKQLQQAIALRHGAQPNYSTPGAAALGGVAHILDTINSNRREEGVRAQQGQLTATQKGAGADFLRYQQAQQERTGRLQQAYVDALRGRGQQQPQATPVQAAPAPSDPNSLGALLSEYGG